MWSGDDTEDVASCELQHKEEGDAQKQLNNDDRNDSSATGRAN